ncbi:hypothetical protein OKA05_20735 [Luteolibacter arcticus]|uniref:Helix-turn-helix domain-containing protein n=1 Tax=Luteolibacter arcticus TaxID=1581411 RepID=A0ABT3GNE6_9BACT|nr:hypothetical protein [Luteolibacter arcticus]MCW1925001.1 hypothetical protein [Luteolibacter arcticus]
MARKLPALGKELVDRIEEAWQQPQADWARKRLLVVRLIALHQSSVAEIMTIAGVCRQTVFRFLWFIMPSTLGLPKGSRLERRYLTSLEPPHAACH